MKKNYDDIINLPHHVSDHHKPMSRLDRAAQFSPFAALTGYEEAVEETARRVDSKLEIDEERASRLNQALYWLIDNLNTFPQPLITYFIADERKAGGQYLSERLRVVKIDTYKRLISCDDGRKINFDDLYEIVTD